MRCCIIGSSGHYGYVLAGLRKDRDTLCAIAPGTPGEDMSGVLRAASGAGFSPRVYEDYREMLRVEKPEVAGVNPWFCDIAPIATELLLAGVHVFAEKPLAVSLEQLAELRKAAQGNAQLTAMFGIRGDAWFRAARAAVEDGLIGDIRMAHARKSYKMGKRSAVYLKRETSGGLIPWVAIHAIDWVYWMTGRRFTEVSAAHSALGNGGNGELEASSAMLYRMEDECIATIQADYLRPTGAARHDDDALRLTGTKGTLTVRDQRVIYEAFGAPTRELPLVPARSLFQDFLVQIEGGALCGVSAEDALYVTQVALLTREAADTGLTQRII